MPVRRRAGKKRATEGLEAWFFVFSGGHDYFDELEPLGIDTDHYSRPSREDSYAAWLRLGEAFLELPRAPEQGDCWALREFGPPTATGKRRLR